MGGTIVARNAAEGIEFVLSLRPAWNRTLPVRISHHKRQSPIRLKNGYLKVAGLLRSKKKWPTQANA